MTDRRPVGSTNSSTRHVFEAMRVIARSDVPLGLNEIAASLDLPASTSHRALMTLEESGFVARLRQSARFEPGVALHHLIRSMVRQFEVRAVAAGPLSEISNRFNVTTSLNWRLGWSSIRLATFEGLQESFQLRRIGELRPLHDGIGPSAILLSLESEERDRYFRTSGLVEILGGTSAVAERMAVFSRQLAEQGYLKLSPTDEFGFCWISVPARRHDGTVGGSFSVGFSMSQRAVGELAADIEQVRRELATLQGALDGDPSCTRTHFDAVDPDDLGTTSSPSRWQVGT